MDEGFSRHRGNNNELIQLALRRCLFSAHSVFPFFQSGRVKKLQSMIIAYILNYILIFSTYEMTYLFEALFRLNLAISIKYWRQSWIACILLYYAMWLVQNFTLSAEHDQLKLVKTWKTRPFEVMHRSSWSLNTSSPRATHKHLTVVLAWGLGISTLPYLQKLSSLSSVKTRLIF